MSEVAQPAGRRRSRLPGQRAPAARAAESTGAGAHGAAAPAGYASASVQRACVFRALQLGDMLCMVPALRSLRAGLPHASITLVGLPWARAFARRFQRYIDDFVEFPGHPAMPEQPAQPQRWGDFVAAMRARRFDLALQMHGSGEVTNALTAEFGAAHSGGFAPAGETRPAATFLHWIAREHEITRYVRLMHHLGMPDRGSALEWPWLEEDEAGLGAQCERLRPRSYVCVHPGARMPSRRWPVERFARVAEALARTGRTIVVTGSADECELSASLVRSMRVPAIDAAGQTSLGGLARLIARASLLVCNDTGVSHVAAAVGTPSVVVCCGADPVRWAPLDRNRHRVVHHWVDCRPCMHWVCPVGHACAVAVEPRAVADRAFALLAAQARNARIA